MKQGSNKLKNALGSFQQVRDGKEEEEEDDFGKKADFAPIGHTADKT